MLNFNIFVVKYNLWHAVYYFHFHFKAGVCLLFGEHAAVLRFLQSFKPVPLNGVDIVYFTVHSGDSNLSFLPWQREIF